MTATTLAASAAAVRPTTSVRINPDNRVVLAGLLLVLVAVAAASFTLSFTGLSAAAPWVAIPTRLAWLVPVVLEVAMLVYVVAAVLRTHRGQSARLAWTLVWVLTTVSSAINALHAWDAGPQSWQGLVGASLAAMFPFMTLAAAHVVVGVAFAPRPDTALVSDTDTGRSPASTDATDSTGEGGMAAGIFSPRMSHPAADTGRDTATDTDARPDADTETTAASAGQAAMAVAVRDVAPFALVVERVPGPRAVDTEAADTRTGGGHRDGRRTRTAPRGRVAELREEIVRLALTTDMSGRAIADALGLGRTVVCPVVTQARARRADTRTPDADGVLLAV